MRFLLVLLLIVVVGCGDTENDSSSAEAMAEGHENDIPTATEAAQEPTDSVETRAVTYGETKNGEPITGYLAVPSSPEAARVDKGGRDTTVALPGLVVIHEWWGLNDNIRTAARRLAGEGYRALAVDLYADSVADTPERAQALMQAATDRPDRLMANLQSAQEYLHSEGGAPRVGVMGWCFGGGVTFQGVADRPVAFDAAVAYYGTPDAMTTAVLEKLETPVLAHFGREDNVVSTEQVEAFQARVQETEADVQIHQYDAGHAFANPSGKNYDAEAAAAAWDRTTAFLATHLSAAETASP